MKYLMRVDISNVFKEHEMFFFLPTIFLEESKLGFAYGLLACSIEIVEDD